MASKQKISKKRQRRIVRSSKKRTQKASAYDSWKRAFIVAAGLVFGVAACYISATEEELIALIVSFILGGLSLVMLFCAFFGDRKTIDDILNSL